MRANLTGLRFGRLIVQERIILGLRSFRWLCICDCGRSKKIATKDLNSGKVQSCGCLISDTCAVSATTHGRSRTSEYRIWNSMLARCGNEKHKSYPSYGGRGIAVCDSWKKFENFFADMGPRPSMLHTLDRYPNNNGNYEPGNCRWSTVKEQNNNRRSNRVVVYRGKTQSLTQAVESVGGRNNYAMVRLRLAKGWDLESAIETPFRSYAKTFDLQLMEIVSIIKQTNTEFDARSPFEIEQALVAEIMETSS